MPDKRSIVVLEAVDWGVYAEKVPPDTGWSLPVAYLAGTLLAENDEKVVLAAQLFGDGSSRFIMIIPKVCIKQRWEFTLEDCA